MGAYSAFEYEDIEVKHPIFFIPVYAPGAGHIEMNPIDVWKNEKGVQEASVSFELWDDIKLEGYWWPTEVAVLNYLRHFIEGNAYFEYESEYSFAIEFRGGKVFVRRQERTWDDDAYEIEDLKIVKE